LFNTYSAIFQLYHGGGSRCLTQFSVISWPSVLLVEETRVPIENHRPATIQTNYNVVTSAPHHERD